MERIILKNENYVVLEKEGCGYCVMKKCQGFWQQITKWYCYKRYAIKYFEKISKNH